MQSPTDLESLIQRSPQHRPEIEGGTIGQHWILVLGRLIIFDRSFQNSLQIRAKTGELNQPSTQLPLGYKKLQQIFRMADRPGGRYLCLNPSEILHNRLLTILVIHLKLKYPTVNRLTKKKPHTFRMHERNRLKYRELLPLQHSFSIVIVIIMELFIPIKNFRQGFRKKLFQAVIWF